jgi:FkbM family methyltransferase
MLKILNKIQSFFRNNEIDTESQADSASRESSIEAPVVTFESEIKRWFGDDGDNTHRLDYPLSEDSLVFDLGGYVGDFTEKVYQKHGCTVYLFEPSKKFFDLCTERFKDNPKVRCFNFALSGYTGTANLSTSDDASSLIEEVITADSDLERVEVRAFNEVFELLNVDQVDLIKINIEGGEYDILPHLIDNGLAKRFNNIQVQFHNFIDGAEVKRDAIQKGLKVSHEMNWCYEFVWENWSLK